EWTYPITHTDSNSTIAIVHADTTLADASGVGAKTWKFFNTGGADAWKNGLISDFLQLSAPSGTVLTTDTYTWSLTGGSATAPIIGSTPYLSQKMHQNDSGPTVQDRKSTRLNSSHDQISYA